MKAEVGENTEVHDREIMPCSSYCPKGRATQSVQNMYVRGHPRKRPYSLTLDGFTLVIFTEETKKPQNAMTTLLTEENKKLYNNVTR
jgi:hypothetical protein